MPKPSSSTDSKNGQSTSSPIPPNASSPQIDPATTKQDETVTVDASSKTEPLAPPPRPDPGANAPDYFSAAHATTHLATEQNPFESSFAGGGALTTAATGEVQTPGGTKLPGIASLASPSAFLQGTPFGQSWASLRSGPLSPAMLSGPNKGAEDYFTDSHLRGGFPTPNESGLRSGLTPGGSGSMFPEPSPSLFGQLASGNQTPATLDFQRTAVNASLQRQAALNITSQPQEHLTTLQDGKAPQGQFDQHDANDAANGLFLLAQARNNPQQPNHYAMVNQMPVQNHAQPMMNMSNGQANSSPSMSSHQHNASISTTSGRGVSEISDEGEQQSRPNTRGKGKRTSTQISQSNGRRKTDDAPVKGPAGKKTKISNGHMEPEPQQSEEELDMNKDEYNANGKKMTDEEKRKNFLERNRVAALKCRQRKKQWLQNLQTKVEAYSAENEVLHNTIAELQQQLVQIKTLLLRHSECSLTKQEGGMQQQQVHQVQQQIQQQQNLLDYSNYDQQKVNPYGVAPMNGQLMAAGQGMQQRRFS